MSHSHAHSPSHDDPIEFTQEFWDDRYQSAGQLWSGQPNPQFAAQAADLAPGEALDAGCGEGADAIWLARRGWTVTAVDVSAVALERAASAALTTGGPAGGTAAAGGAAGGEVAGGGAAGGEVAGGEVAGGEVAGGEVARRITWRREDLLTWVPEPERYDLVSAQFMHFPPAELAAFHERLAAAVRPGGTLLLIAHHPDDVHAMRKGRPDLFWYAEDIAASLPAERWAVTMAEAADRSAIDLDGQPVTVRDTVLRAVRRR